MKITLTGAMLKAALTHAAKQDVRYYLNGVLIEATARETRVVATDGHRACIIRAAAENDLGQLGVVPQIVTFIMPRDVIDAMKIAARDLRSAAITLESTDGKEWRVSGPCSSVVFKPVDGKFPDYRRIVPEKSSGEAGHYNPDYLLDAKKALMLLTGSKQAMIRVHPNGTDAALVTGLDPNFVGVIMPYRMHDAKTKEPLYMHDVSWAKGDLPGSPDLKKAA